MIELSKMVICLRKSPNQRWGLGRGLSVQSAIWWGPPASDKGWGGRARNRRCPLPHFLSGPDVWCPCRGASGSHPIIQLLFNFVFKQSYQNRTSDGCTVLSWAPRRAPEVIRRGRPSSRSYLRQHRYCVWYKIWQAPSQTNGGRQNKPLRSS